MRIQILELPTVVIGEAVETPFALIIDEAAELERSAVSLSRLLEFKEMTGARAVGIFPDTVEIVRA